MQNLRSVLWFLFGVLGAASCTDSPSEAGPPELPPITINLQGEWARQPVPQAWFNTADSYGGTVYAGGDSGAFKTSLSSGEWMDLGLREDSVTINDFALWNEQEVLAATDFLDDLSLEVSRSSLAKTTDGGQTWEFLNEEFAHNGFEFGSRELEINPDNPAHLLATVSSVFFSPDSGQTWEFSFQTPGFFGALSYNPQSPKVIWAVGRNNLFSPAVISTSDGGTNWQIEPVGGAGFAWDVVFHPAAGRELLIATDIDIRRITDTGSGVEVEIVLEDIAAHCLARSPQDGRIVYAAGATASGRLFVAASADFGSTWQQVEYTGGPQQIFSNDLAVIPDGVSDVLYFATNKGVYRYRIGKVIEE